jgi:hypothetical protein
MCSREILLGVSYNPVFLHLILSAQNKLKNCYVGEYLYVRGTYRTRPRILMCFCGIVGLNLRESLFPRALQKRNSLRAQAITHPSPLHHTQQARPPAPLTSLLAKQEVTSKESSLYNDPSSSSGAMGGLAQCW